MMQIPRFLPRPIRRFLGDDRASVTVEMVMVLPILLWGYFGMFILFDAYRALSSNIRVGYTISDMLSREKEAIDGAYIEGLNDIQDVLTQSPHRTVLRVTTVSYDLVNDVYNFEGSYSTAGKDPISAADLNTKIVPYLPTMQHGDNMIVVETWVAYVPFLNITLEQLYQMENKSDRVAFGAFYFEAIVTTRPRFAPKLEWAGPVGGGGVDGGNDDPTT